MANEYYGFGLTEAAQLKKLLDARDAEIAALETSVANLNAWATALATKLNADAGVTDTNYDTDPQA